jgi:very-short-patch-repair endonuclease
VAGIETSFGPPAADRLIADLADRQHGVVEHGQLIRLGLTAAAIKWRLAHGRLHHLHVGVYAVGHRKLTAAGRRLAAVLACGPGALLSHETAGDVLNIRPSASPKIHVSIPTRSGRKRPGIVIHRPRTLAEDDRMFHDGLPVTSPARTLLDLAGRLDAPSLRKAVERSARHGLLDVSALHDRASRKLRQAIADADVGDVRSDLESDFLALCRRHGLPRPEVNVAVGDHVVDFLWPEQRLVVEVDGWEFHKDRASFASDRRRDIDLTLAGLTVARLTHDDVTHAEQDAAARVRALLRGTRAGGTT